MLMATELRNIKNKTICERITILLKPFIDYRNDDASGEFSITVVPESLRTYFYIEFWIFCFIGIITTHSASSWNGFSRTSNPILDTFGNNNICIYFDNPPFSYFGAALFVPIILTGVLYLFVDLNRVYFSMKNPKYPNITPLFYKLYKYTTIFITFSMAFFIQVFATQPTQNMAIHWIPFGILQWAMWLMGIQHYLYFLKMDIIRRDSKNYWCGIVYLIAMGITVVIKFSMDLANLGGAKLWEPQDQYGWVKDLASINDAAFMFTVTICPFFIYLIFVDNLDHVRFAIKSIMSTSIDEQQLHLLKIDN